CNDRMASKAGAVAREFKSAGAGLFQACATADYGVDYGRIGCARARTITHPYLGRRGVAVVCHQCQLVAVERITVGGKLQTEYFNAAVAVVEGHSSGIAREDRKTGLRLHGAGDLTIGIGPVA